VGRVQPLTAYLSEARANLPDDHPWSERADAARGALVDDVRHTGNGEEARDERALARELEDLKREYVAVYAGLHRRLVLGPQADERRARLYDDPRLAALNALVEVELLNRGELDAWKDTITGLRPCRQFHEGTISDTPTCPECHLRPVRERYEDVHHVLDTLDGRLDEMLLHWRQALRDALGSGSASCSLRAMAASERQPIEQFLAQEDDDPAIPAGFATAATQALRGIEALTLPVDGLLAALRQGGLPCTVEELKRRFDSYVRDAMRHRDATNTRLTLDR
jgi:hypothetical protein